MAALADTPVVLLRGARQTGKTTLVRNQLDLVRPVYRTFDDRNVMASATADPPGFLQSLLSQGETLVLDEIQLVPTLFPAIKLLVDADRRPGRFLLTGSANLFLLPRLSESLAGRMQPLTLFPLAQSEIESTNGANPVDLLFDSTPEDFYGEFVPQTRSELVRRVLRGGFPEPLERTPERRRRWFEGYLETLLQRDIRDYGNIEGLTQMPRLLTLLALRVGSLLNVSDLSRSINVPYTTLNRYLTLLEALYLFQPLPAWTSNLSNRLIKSPKAALIDSGFAAHLAGINEARLERDPNLFGGLLENFVLMELRKESEWSETRPEFFHFHTTKWSEVDLVLERRDGALVGIEVKALATVTASDFSGLSVLREMTGDRLIRGVLFYSGTQSLSFGDRLTALPLSWLWSSR